MTFKPNNRFCNAVALEPFGGGIYAIVIDIHKAICSRLTGRQQIIIYEGCIGRIVELSTYTMGCYQSIYNKYKYSSYDANIQKYI